jgi:glycosyltransferase involved in cell wall biosynthesis
LLRIHDMPARRILLVAPSPPPYGGMALQARLLEKFLRADGDEVAFVPSNSPLPAALRFAERIPGLRTVLRFFTVSRRIWRQAADASVVHVLAASWVYFFAVAAPAVFIARLRGRRVVLNYRGGEAARFFRWFGWAAWPVFRLAHSVTAPSGFLAGIIRGRFRVPVAIVPNILDLSAFRFRHRSGFGPRLLATRHLEPIYDLESVLRAFRAVHQRYPEASLWIAGTGSREAHLRALVSAWNLPGVRFLGHVRHQDLPALCDQRDILLNASRVDNFPGALLEASAAGLLVVSTAAGGIPFIYRDGETALLVEPGDWQALARAVIRSLESPALASSLALAGASLARRCDWRQVRLALDPAYGFGEPGPGLPAMPAAAPEST